MKSFFLPIFFLFGTLNLSSQIQIIKSQDFKLNAGISEAEVTQIVQILNVKLEEYKKKGRLKNPNTGKVDREIVKQFRELFTLNALVYDDFSSNPDIQLLPIEGYIERIKSIFGSYGVLFSIETPILKSIQLLDGTYYCVVEVIKQTEQYYDNNQMVRQGFKVHELAIEFDVTFGTSVTAAISRIRPSSNAKPPAYFINYLGMEFGAMYHLPVFQDFKLAFPTDVDGTIEFTKGISYSVGGTWRSNSINARRKSSKHLFVLAGVKGQFQDLTWEYKEGGISDQLVDYLLDDKGFLVDSLVRSVSGLSISERFTALSIYIPLGVMYRIKELRQANIILDFNIQPGIMLNPRSVVKSSAGEYQVKASGYYDSSDGNTKSIMDLKEDLLLTNTQLDYDYRPSVSLAAQAGVGLYYFRDFEDNLSTSGIGIGVDLLWGLRSGFDDIKEGKALWRFVKGKQGIEYPPITKKDPRLFIDLGNEDAGLLGNYIQQLSLRSVGIRLIYFIKRGKKP